MKTLLAVSLAMLSLTVQAAIPTTVKGTIWDLDMKNPLYTYHHKSSAEGDVTKITNSFFAPDGIIMAVEETVMKGNRVSSYEVAHSEMNAHGKVEVSGDKINFSYTRDGKTKNASEKLKGNVVVGPTLIPFMRENWKALTDGNEIDVRFAVTDRLETVGFTLKKVESKDYKGQKAVIIRMKPTSFLIAALVKPVHFTMSANADRLLEMRGRVVPKKKEGGTFKDLDGVTVYEF